MNQTGKTGMNNETFFFDTYALFEIVRGSENYKKFRDCKIITTIFNLAEFNYNLKKETDKETADRILEKYKDEEVKVTLEDVKQASNLKIKHKKMSIPDVIGYVVAKRHGVKFLTGDNDFQGFENVEFVKK